MTLSEVLGSTRRATVGAGVPLRVDRSLVRQLWRHGGARSGMIVGTMLLFFAAFGSWLAPQPPNAPNYAAALEGPSLSHWAGTDAAGRDVASRLIDGAPRTLGSAILVLAAIVAVGLVVGVASAVAGGFTDAVLMRIVDVAMTVPGLVLAYAVIGLLGPGFAPLLIALVVADWAYFARLSRSYALTARGQPHIIAARLAGVSWPRIVMTHILPAVVIPLSIVASIDLGEIVGTLAAFSFLGLGVQPPYAEWGSMLADSRFYFPIAPWLLIGPAALITLCVLAANLVGNGLRDVLDAGAAR